MELVNRIRGGQYAAGFRYGLLPTGAHFEENGRTTLSRFSVKRNLFAPARSKAQLKAPQAFFA